jgi:RNA polymerase sigma factor (sigma-70 family)
MNRKTRTAPHVRGIEAYLNTIGATARLTPEEEHTLSLAWRDHRHADARERLINANLRLVVMVARRYAGRGIPLDDLVAEGNLGLIKAIDNFDPHAGVRVSTYAVYWIQGAITELFSRSSILSRLAPAARSAVRDLERASGAFQIRHGRTASDRDLAESLGWEMSQVREARETIASRTRAGAMIEADAPAAASTISHTDSDDADRIASLLSQLSDRERRVIELQFGLNHHRPCSVSQVARITKTSPRIARMQLQSAMRKMTLAAARTGA